MIYSIIPQNVIFDDKKESDIKIKQIEYKGITLQVMETEDNYIIHRIISTDLSNYLNNDIVPGAMLQKQKFN